MAVSTGITNIAKQKLLNVLCGGAASSGSQYIGLATAMPSSVDPTLANITEVTTPGYSRQSVTWGGATFPAPVFDQNSAAITFGPVTADMATGANYAFLCDQATATALAAPAGLAGTVTGSGGNFGSAGYAPVGAYFWTVTALNAQGETVSSNEISGTIAANGKNSLSWSAVSGATSYNVYRATVSGQENVLVNSSAVTATTFVDTGALGTSQTPPSVTTAPAGNIWYVWALTSPALALNGNPITLPINGLTIQ